jgi:hypothetical protein
VNATISSFMQIKKKQLTASQRITNKYKKFRINIVFFVDGEVLEVLEFKH